MGGNYLLSTTNYIYFILPLGHLMAYLHYTANYKWNRIKEKYLNINENMLYDVQKQNITSNYYKHSSEKFDRILLEILFLNKLYKHDFLH